MVQRRSFTLIELIVAMAVIAIMAGVGVSVYSGVRQRSNDNVAIAQADQLFANFSHYAALNGGAYPNGCNVGYTNAITFLGSYAELPATSTVLGNTWNGSPGDLWWGGGPMGAQCWGVPQTRFQFAIVFRAIGGTGTEYVRTDHGLGVGAFPP